MVFSENACILRAACSEVLEQVLRRGAMCEGKTLQECLSQHLTLHLLQASHIVLSTQRRETLSLYPLYRWDNQAHSA